VIRHLVNRGHSTRSPGQAGSVATEADPVSGTATQESEVKRATRDLSRRTFLASLGALGTAVHLGHGRCQTKNLEIF